jgi:hypothetical protein
MTISRRLYHNIEILAQQLADADGQLPWAQLMPHQVDRWMKLAKVVLRTHTDANLALLSNLRSLYKKEGEEGHELNERLSEIFMNSGLDTWSRLELFFKFHQQIAPQIIDTVSSEAHKRGYRQMYFHREILDEESEGTEIIHLGHAVQRSTPGALEFGWTMNRDGRAAFEGPAFFLHKVLERFRNDRFPLIWIEGPHALL